MLAVAPTFIVLEPAYKNTTRWRGVSLNVLDAVHYRVEARGEDGLKIVVGTLGYLEDSNEAGHRFKKIIPASADENIVLVSIPEEGTLYPRTSRSSRSPSRGVVHQDRRTDLPASTRNRQLAFARNRHQ